MSGTSMLKRRWVSRIVPAVFAFFLGTFGTASALDSLPYIPGRTALDITDTVYAVDNSNGVNTANILSSIDITSAPANPNGAGLVVGSAAWTNEELYASTLTMTGGGGAIPPVGTYPASYAGLAVLGVNYGNELTAYTMTVNDYSLVAIGYDFNGGADSAGTLLTNTLFMNGAGSEIRVGSGSMLYADQSMTIEAGTLAVRLGGTVQLGNTLSAIGSDSIIRMNGGTITAGSSAGAGVYLDSGASLLAEGGTNRVGGDLFNNGGYIHVASGSILNLDKLYHNSSDTSNGRAAGLHVEGALNVDKFMLGSSDAGTALIASGGTVAVSEMAVESGALTVAFGGTLRGTSGGTFAQSGGASAISGTMSGFSSIAVDGGSFTVSSSGELAGPGVALYQTGGTVAIQGKVASAAIIDVSGGNLNLGGTAYGIGTTSGLNNLSVSGAANVTVGTTLSARSFSMSGGSMTLASGTLEVQNQGGALGLGGVWNMNGGSVAFNNDVTFAGGTINANANGAAIDMGGNSLRINSTLYANGNMIVTNVDNAGSFTLGGGYIVGFDTGADTRYMVTVEGAGEFVLGAGARVELSVGARREYNTLGGDMLILGTDAPAGAGGPMSWSSSAVKYTYEVKDDGSGNYGLYVTDVYTLNRDEQRRNLLAAWSKEPRVGGYLGNVFNESFINAVIDGNALGEGLVDGYDKLNQFGKFNASELADIMTPSASGAAYDALMLYNGSGLTTANEAVVSTGRHLLRRVSDRAGVIRRETIVDEIEPPEGPCETQDGVDAVYGEPKATRMWAEGIYHSDAAGFRDGFAGYEYRGKGLMIGADKRVGKAWYGGTFSYVGGDYEDAAALASNSDINTYAGLLFGGMQSESGLYVNGTLGYAYSDNRIRDYRYLNGQHGWNTADYGTHSFLAAFEGGKDFWLGDSVIVTPSAGIAYVGARGNSHEQWFEGEGGIGAQTLVADKVTGHSITLPVNLAVSWDVFAAEDSLLSITGKVGYAYEFHNKGATGDFRYGGLEHILNPVSAVSREPGKHTLNLGISARYLYRNIEFGAGYDYVGRKKYNSHAFTISAGMNF